jgi:ribosomal protein S18 acetylase RimI-like enzyme
MAKVTSLSYRKRLENDDPFIIKTSLSLMKEMFKQSVGIGLREDIIRQQIRANETVMIIERNNKPIGFYMYTVFPSGEMYLSSLILVPHVQNQGIGTEVVHHIISEARKINVQKIIGHVQISNENALTFWKKNKFRVIGRPIHGSVEIQRSL